MYDTNVWLNSADQFIQMSLDIVQVAIVAGHSGPASAGLQLKLCGIVGVGLLLWCWVLAFAWLSGVVEWQVAGLGHTDKQDPEIRDPDGAEAIIVDSQAAVVCV